MEVMGFVWKSGAETCAQTIVVKATFVLEPGHAKLAPESEREPIHDRDQFVKGESKGALFVPTDRVPYKPRVDVMLVGHAYAPGKQPVRSLVTKLVVGDFSKSIEVFCDRGFRSPEERLLEGPRFTKMALDWTRAAGGPGTTNPVGMSFDAAPNAFLLISVPNLQPPKTLVTKGSDTFAPVGYGPVAPSWPGRKQRIERFAGTFAPTGWDDQGLPEGFDFEYFQAAPPDQQIARIRPDERLVLEHLHPAHAQLETRLPGVSPRAIVHRASGEREDVTLVADTLWIDSDRGIACVVWRGSIGLRHPTEAGLIDVTLVEPVAESIDESLVVTIPPGVVDENELVSMTSTAPFVTKAKGSAMPFVGTNSPERPSNPVRTIDDGALPFGPSGLSGIPPAPIAMGQITLPAQSPTSSPTVPEIKMTDAVTTRETMDSGETLQLLWAQPDIEEDQKIWGEKGRFVPPMVVVEGELELPFDELETLKATISTAMAAITPANVELEAAVMAAKNFVQTLLLSASPAVSEGLTRRIREAFVKEQKTLPLEYLDTQVERVLLLGRHYQKRMVFGGAFVRCFFWLPDEALALVAYLPADVATKLPMWRRFRARVMAEVHPAQDQYEEATRAFKIVAVGRVVTRASQITHGPTR